MLSNMVMEGLKAVRFGLKTGFVPKGRSFFGVRLMMIAMKIRLGGIRTSRKI
jgi:hypothetical protein